MYDKQHLLQIIADIAPANGQAESESDQEDLFLKNFLSIPAYRGVLDFPVWLILGGRGAGKSELFKLLAFPNGRQVLFEQLGIPSTARVYQAYWVSGFGRAKQQETGFPTPESIADMMQQADGLDWRAFWLGLLLGSILRHQDLPLPESFTSKISPEMKEALTVNLSRPSVWFPLVRQEIELVNHLLDEWDQHLIQLDKFQYVTYDELDRIVPTYEGLMAPIRELLALWLDRWRRWERIRPKIFLRSDLFGSDVLRFPDASKLSGHQVRLEWTVASLYQLLIKRLVNADEEMKQYLGQIPGLIPDDKKPSLLGLMPRKDEALFEKVIEQMIGPYMGANPRRGMTYRWIPNHLQDTVGRIAPRSFLKIFVLAARRRQEMEQLQGDLLLHPSDLQGALMDTSKDRLLELKEEYGWIEALEKSLAGINLLVERDFFLEKLDATPWSDEPKKKPPGDTPEEILDFMEKIGMVNKRLDGRINMPEIYLHGLGMTRRGGVKRPK